jgi:hypothetical protein
MPTPIITLIIAVSAVAVAALMYREYRRQNSATENDDNPGVIRGSIIDIAAWFQQEHQISTAVYRTTFVLIWGGMCYLAWLAIASLYVIEPGFTSQPVRGLGNDIGIALLYIGGPLSLAWLTWHGFSALFVHSSHKELREQLEALEHKKNVAEQVIRENRLGEQYRHRLDHVPNPGLADDHFVTMQQ